MIIALHAEVVMVRPMSNPLRKPRVPPNQRARWFLSLALAAPCCASAQDAPQPPAPQPVQADAGHTALLVLDFSTGPCGSRPRCLAALPAEAALLAKARTAGMTIIYSVAPGETRADIEAPLTPQPGDEVVESGPDKFVGTNLAASLQARNITTVIITGTAAEGAVLDTGLDAGLREGLNLIVPVDLIPSSTLYAERYVAWNFANAPAISAQAVITRSDLIGF